jgi:hypothetical protein
MRDTLDEFVYGYILAALWYSTDSNDVPLDQNHSPSDLTPHARNLMVEDCTAFVFANEEQLLRASDELGRDMDHLGHDFWLTRNRHGAGFWDRYELDIALRNHLTDAAHAFGECSLYVNDDGQIDIG